MGSVLTPSQNNPSTEENFPESVTNIQPPQITNTGINNVPFFHTKKLIPSLPIVKKLPADYKSKFQLVGLNKDNTPYYTTINNSSNNNNNYHNIIYLLFLLIPRSIFKIFSFFWSVLSRLFNNDPDSIVNKPKIFRLPKYPTHDTNTINLSKLLLTSPNTEVSAPSLNEQKLNKLYDLLGDTGRDRLSFNEMLDICEKEFKFLFVVLLGELDTTKCDVNSQKFLSHVLSDDGVLKILDGYKDNLLVYMGSVTEIEPWLVARNLGVKYTPECFMIGNVLNSNNSLNGTLRLSVLSKLRVTSPKRLQNSLKLVFDRYGAELVVSKNEMEELRISREIKQLQEQAYQESLLKDQLKEEAKQLKLQEIKQKRIEEVDKQQRLKIEKTYKVLKWLSNCIDIFKDAMSKVSINEKNEDSKKQQFTTLQFRTSKGTRFIKKFDENTSLYSIYNHIGCHLFLLNDSLNSASWKQSILDKIEELENETSLLCFKGAMSSTLKDEKIDFTDLETLIKEELIKLEDIKKQNGMSDDDEAFKV